MVNVVLTKGVAYPYAPKCQRISCVRWLRASLQGTAQERWQGSGYKNDAEGVHSSVRILVKVECMNAFA